MFYVIITCRSLLWILLSLAAMLLILTALVNPAWLVADVKSVKVENETKFFSPSVGVYTKCSKPLKNDFYKYPPCTSFAVEGLSTHSNVFPTVWKVSVVMLSIGLCIMCLTVCSGIISCCFQSIFKKSIFTISGATQAFAGIWFILGVMLYPMGWGSERVQKLCGREASPFYPGECSFGIGIYMGVAGTILTFVAACLSVSAEKSTSSDSVQDQIDDGQSLICLP